MKRRGVLLVSTAGALVAGCCLAVVSDGVAVAGPSGYGPAAMLARMSEAQKIGQLFMAGVPATGPVSSAIKTD
ncbi:MAG: hypothetical protein J2P27_10450, partial [Actinobacteria bacterium]|nr:hypothetical protein [Actinomycetota bacterium]